MTELLLIRHGQATHNLEQRWEGWGSTPLTEEGLWQAEAIAQHLASSSGTIVRLYSSPLLRATQTAQPIGERLRLPLTIHEGLREIDFGQVSGLTAETFRQSMPQVYARWQDRGNLAFQFPGGEQRLTFFRRVGQALDEIVSDHPAQKVVVVAHGGTIRAGLAHLFPDTMRDWWAYTLSNASLTHVHVGKEGNMLAALNDVRHLDGNQKNE